MLAGGCLTPSESDTGTTLWGQFTSESDTGTTLWGRFTSESDTEPLNQVSDSEGVRHRLLCTRTPKVSDTACCVYRAAQAAAGAVHAIYARQTTTVCAMPGCWSTI